MECYQLQPDETILYKGNVTKVEKYKKESFLNTFSASPTTELIFTNKNLILTTRTKKMFAPEQLDVEVLPLSDIKFYDDVPQIKRDNDDVEIYLLSGELYLAFNSRHESSKFYQTAVQTLTGKSLATRSAEKVKAGIGLVDDTLGISTVETVKGVLENGLAKTFFAGFKKNKTPTQSIPQKESNKEQLTYEEQVDALSKMKSLLDSGILTQEEFDAKKKEILGL